MTRRHSETVVRLTPRTKTGRYSGEPEIDWTQPPIETPIDGVLVAPGGSGGWGGSASRETHEIDRESATTAFTLFCPTGTYVERHERVRVRGEDYEIEGELGSWPRGVVIVVRRKEG